MESAVVGLAGVVLGIVATIAGDVLRARRERQATLRRRQDSLVSVLRQTNVVVGGAGMISDTLAQAPGTATFNMDLTELDAACTDLSQAIDELRVLGPTGVVEPAVDLLEVVLDARQNILGGADPGETKAIAERVFSEKEQLLEAARASDLLDGAR